MGSLLAKHPSSRYDDGMTKKLLGRLINTIHTTNPAVYAVATGAVLAVIALSIPAVRGVLFTTCAVISHLI